LWKSGLGFKLCARKQGLVRNKRSSGADGQGEPIDGGLLGEPAKPFRHNLRHDRYAINGLGLNALLCHVSRRTQALATNFSGLNSMAAGRGWYKL
jgi:hypothetical protein